jgi:hypothetical protein
MRLDMDVVRRILIAIEATPANQYPDDVTLPDVDENTVLEHLELLIEHGLLEGRVIPSGIGSDGRLLAVSIQRMTWKGHEFIDTARNEAVWERTKAVVKEKGGSLSFDLIKGVLFKVAAQHFGLSL